MTMAAILKHKGAEVYTVRPTSTIAEVAQILASRRIGAVVVTNSAGGLIGILSERDIAYGLAVDGGQTHWKTAEQLMTHAVKTVTLQTTTDEAMAIMTTGQFRHLPVLDRGTLVGMVSIGDVVKNKIMQHETAVERCLPTSPVRAIRQVPAAPLDRRTGASKLHAVRLDACLCFVCIPTAITGCNAVRHCILRVGIAGSHACAASLIIAATASGCDT